MSATEDLPPAAQVVSLSLRREALLPTERGRGLGTVAVVCTMAGVASGLALATTLMAMQVADSMSTRQCPYQVEVMPLQMPDPGRGGFLGVTYTFKDGGALISNVVVGSPAETIGLHPGDKLLAVDGVRITSKDDFYNRIASQPPGATPSLVVLHDGATQTVRPVLTVHPLTLNVRY